MMTIEERYAAAGKLMTKHTKKAVLNGRPSVKWLDDDTLYYAEDVRNGENVETRFVKVACATGEKTDLFDHARLIALLKEKGLEKDSLPFKSCKWDEGKICFTWEKQDFRFDTESGELTGKFHAETGENVSPDGKHALFFRGHNLWLRDTETGEEKALTFDGEEYNDYASSCNYGDKITRILKGEVEKPSALWNEDGTRFVTYKLDQRKVKYLPIIQSFDDENLESIRPRLHTYKCPFPEDTDDELPQYTLYVCDLEKNTFKKVQGVETSLRPMGMGKEYSSAKWMEDGKGFIYTWRERCDHLAKMYYVDAETATGRVLVSEHSETFQNYGAFGLLDGFGSYTYSNFLTQDRKTVVWQSERDDMAHYFRYNAETGELMNTVTDGEYLAQCMIHVDEENEWIYFMAMDVPGMSQPLYHVFCRVHFDGAGFEVLTPEDAEHSITCNGKYFVDTYSRVDMAPVTKLYSMDGKCICTLEEADISDLLALGYIIPERFTVKARDGVTDLHGILIKPRDFDPDKTYPLVDYIYGGAQTYNVPLAFTYDQPMGREIFGGLQEYAQLGFVGMILDGMGTPGRGKKFHDDSYLNIHGVCGLKDHVTARDELKEKFPFIDMERLGMWGNSGGGCATSRAMLEYPGVYKVGVSSAGNHDQRMYNNSWVERYYDKYDPEVYNDNCALAKNLEGKLFIVHGAMDDNVAMSQSIRLIDALIEENKEFDFLILPRVNHNVPANPYFIRKKMDYFVKHLLGEEPPKSFKFE